MITVVYRRTSILVGIGLLLGLTTALAPWIWDTLHATRGYQRIALNELGKFPLDDQGGVISDVPQAFRMLDGKRVVAVGKMWAGGSAIRASKFELLYDVARRGWERPRVQERVFAKMRPGGTVPLQGPYELVQVFGTLHVRLKRNDAGTIISVYDMDVDRVACPPEPEPAAWWTGGLLVAWTVGILAIVDVLLRWRLEESREIAGRCRRCGYDLRATPDRCPECGTLPGRAASWTLAMDRAQTESTPLR